MSHPAKWALALALGAAAISAVLYAVRRAHDNGYYEGVFHERAEHYRAHGSSAHD